MGDISFDSAGVTAKEIDLSGPTPTAITDVPAGIIGTAARGPAFVPVTVTSIRDFEVKFGRSDGTRFGPIAVAEWLRSAGAATYVRVLGAGDGTKRTTTGNNTGRVNKAGFIVGDKLPNFAGNIDVNPFSYTTAPPPGRLAFLGCFMSESAGSTVFSEALIQGNHNLAAVAGDDPVTARSMPIIRGVLMIPSGITVLLSGNSGLAAYSDEPSATTAATSDGPRGMITGTVKTTNNEFTLLVNGLVTTTESDYNAKRVITASFNVNAMNYFANVLNTDPTKMQQFGHVLYTRYDVPDSYAHVTGTGIFPATGTLMAGDVAHTDYAFILTSSLTWNSGSTVVPNYENFEDRYHAAKTPWFISQKFGSQPSNLFKVHALDDGAVGNTTTKISITNITPSTTTNDPWGTFSLIVREFNDSDYRQSQLERWDNLSLNVNSERYIARVIGNQHTFYDFDRNAGSQRLVVDGEYPNVSSFIRVEMHDDVKNGRVDASALPVGFRGHGHLITSGSGLLSNIYPVAGGSGAGSISGSGFFSGQTDVLNRAVVPAVPFRKHLVLGTGLKQLVNSDLHWGVQFEKRISLTDPNATEESEKSIESFTKYFPTYHTTWQNPWVEDNVGKADANGVIFDVDRFNNGKFTLENVKVVTGSDTYADPGTPESWVYVRTGSFSASPDAKTRAFQVNDLKNATVRKYMKFTTFLQGGFDGVNIFNKDMSNITNTAVKQDMDDTNRGQQSGSSVTSYKKAVDLVGSTADVDIKLLAIPGIRHSAVTDYAISSVESRFDALYIMDVEERDNLNTVVTSSATQLPSVQNTVAAFKLRALDSNFAAAYFPDVTIDDERAGKLVSVPPTVAVIGAIANNDAVAFPWFAPAGFSRGVLPTTKNLAVMMNKDNLDTLYSADINPLTSFPGTNGIVVWGQKTLQAAAGALDRVNVRRLMIEIRRQVRAIANTILFEPNREATLARFSREVTPRLQLIQQRSGVDRFKVQIDTTTTTQADVENNTIRGKIIVQPTKTAEFVSLDFVVSNAGNNI